MGDRQCHCHWRLSPQCSLGVLLGDSLRSDVAAAAAAASRVSTVAAAPYPDAAAGGYAADVAVAVAGCLFFAAFVEHGT